MSNPIRVGILGCAQIAQRSLAPAFLGHPAFRLVAVASRTPDKAATFIANLPPSTSTPVPCAYDELVSSSSVDLIYCPLPTGLHYEWVMKSLDAGKHVLCEKSFACNSAEAEELMAKAKEKNLFLMESFQFRFHAQNLRAREIIDAGNLGAIRCVRASFGFPPFPDGEKNIRYKKALGGGALLDAGAYTIKASIFLLGHDLEVLAASSWTEPGQEVDIGGSIMMRNAAGIVSETAFGFNNFYQCGYEVWGEKGKLTLSRAFTAPHDFPAELKLELPGQAPQIEKIPDRHFDRLLDYVSKCILTGDFEEEYRQCQTQSRLITQTANLSHLSNFSHFSNLNS